MNKKLIIFILLLLTGMLVLTAKQELNLSPTASSSSNNSKGAVILYYGITCPHCEIVKEWLDNKPGIKKKSRLEMKEVYQNKNNSRELVEKAAECQIDERDGIGVPFLYDNGECIVGDQPIIDYLKEKYQ